MKRLINDDLEFLQKTYVEGKYKIKCINRKKHKHPRSHTFSCMDFKTPEAEVIARLILEVKRYKAGIEDFIERVVCDDEEKEEK